MLLTLLSMSGRCCLNHVFSSNWRTYSGWGSGEGGPGDGVGVAGFSMGLSEGLLRAREISFSTALRGFASSLDVDDSDFTDDVNDESHDGRISGTVGSG